MANKMLNIMGCYPENLEILFELEEHGEVFNAFNIINNKNTNADLASFYLPKRKVFVYDLEADKSHTLAKLIEAHPLAFGVVGVNNKPEVFNHFAESYDIDKKQFINLFHPTSVISPSSNLDFGIQVEALSTISAFAKIGFGVTIKRNCSVGHHCDIRDYVTLNPGVIVSSKVIIENNSMLGTGSIVKDGIHIGAHTITGAGSVVVKDVPSNVVAFGNPCKIYRKNKNV